MSAGTQNPHGGSAEGKIEDAVLTYADLSLDNGTNPDVKSNYIAAVTLLTFYGHPE